MPTAATQRVLIKLRPSSALRAAESAFNLRPLYEAPDSAERLGLAGEPRWFLADLPASDQTAWDLAHARVADQLGVAEDDVVFVEPDLVHDIYRDGSEQEAAGRLAAVGDDCRETPQNDKSGEAIGPKNGWHLGSDFSQLADARAAVTFKDPLTRIAHLDTGYYAAHVTRPRHLLTQFERNFVEKDQNPGSAEDPDNKAFLIDNSGHGTGTLGILAGNRLQALGIDLGGAPDAAVVPLRIADRVVLLHTSAFARALRHAVDAGCDVASMSMGGLPSEAWREAVDRAYLAGLCIVTAAGNNFGGLPTRHVVYPARYARVIAACGVMANGAPYAHLRDHAMEGNFGPGKIMKHALGAYTPNIPWALYGCPSAVRWSGGGTSAATPQIAAAVALWFERYKSELPRDWRRVEAVRKALFTTARKVHGDELGNGILQAAAALGVRPDLTLPQTKSSGDSFAFIRIMTGLGVTEPTPRERMFNLEIVQRWLLNPDLQQLVPDPEAATEIDEPTLARFMEALIADPAASLALRRQLASRYHVALGRSAPPRPGTEAILTDSIPACEGQPNLQDPPYRRLRVYATDPSLSVNFDTQPMNEVTLQVCWEPLKPGPVGEYLSVEDQDASGKTYAGVDLNDARLLAQDGWAPSEGNPQFHQQMVYAVSMKTIEHFEHALGRPVLWRHRGADQEAYVRRLTVRPHALRQANAYYSPDAIALQFGYFDASDDDPGDHVPGSRVYACLSHDIVAHETTHAILDGMHYRFNDATNPDVLAFHEAFADIVALMQHFTITEMLVAEIARTRGNLEAESLLGSLALQFGRSSGGRGALRDAIGRVENGVWRRLEPDASGLQKATTPHSRGAILVAAIFDAFLSIYNARIVDLLRLSTGGTGVLPGGAIHPDLVNRLAGEAAKSASHVLSMCIRAIDYLPPVDVTFFDYLRALITADFDLVSDDRHNYRVAFVEAFRRRGIFPPDPSGPSRSMSVDTLRWRGLEDSLVTQDWPAIRSRFDTVIRGLRHYADTCSYIKSRETLFRATWKQRRKLEGQLSTAFQKLPAFAAELGIDMEHPFAVAELRRAARIGPDGRYVPQVIVALTQSVTAPATEDGTPQHLFHSGATLVVDFSASEIKYRILKNSTSALRRKRTAEFIRDTATDPLRRLFLSSARREPFAVLHSLVD